MNKLFLPLPLALLLALLRAAAAQDDQVSYPTWVTNDYSCVISCMEGQFANASPPASKGQTAGALGCVRDACSKETAQGNVYQAHYIINMFNAIGSNYEPESWQAGNAPDASDLTAPEGWTQTATTTTWTESDQPTTITTSVWVPPATSSDAPHPAASTSISASATESASQAVQSAPSSSSVRFSSIASVSSSEANGTASNGTDVNGGARIAPVHVGLSVFIGLGAIAMGGVAGGVGLLGL